MHRPRSYCTLGQYAVHVQCKDTMYNDIALHLSLFLLSTLVRITNTVRTVYHEKRCLAKVINPACGGKHI